MATSDPFLLVILLLYALGLMAVGYILFMVYRSRTRKVRKLR